MSKYVEFSKEGHKKMDPNTWKVFFFSRLGILQKEF